MFSLKLSIHHDEGAAKLGIYFTATESRYFLSFLCLLKFMINLKSVNKVQGNIQ